MSGARQSRLRTVRFEFESRALRNEMARFGR